MAKVSVTQWNEEDQPSKGVDWEEQSYREGYALARERARMRLESMDDELLRRKPVGWTVMGFRQRTLVTRFGEVVVSQRMYRVSDGDAVFAPDEYLGWKPQQQASVSLTESLVAMASALPFRKVDELLSDLMRQYPC